MRSSRSACLKTFRGEADGRSPVRWDLVERLRLEIASGTYVTPEKWSVALERLLRDACR